MGKVPASNFPSDSVEANPFPQRDLSHHLLILGHVLRQLLKGCQLAGLPLVLVLAALRLTAAFHALPPIPPGIVGGHQAASIHVHGGHRPPQAHISASADRHRRRAGEEQSKGPRGWARGVRACQSPASLTAGLQSHAVPFVASGRGGQRRTGRQSLPGQAKSCPPHRRHFAPSFTVRCPALTVW